MCMKKGAANTDKREKFVYPIMSVKSKTMVAEKPHTVSVFTYLRQQEERLRMLGRMRSSEMLRTATNRLVEFRQGEDLTFHNLSPDLLLLFEASLKAKQLRRNTIGFYMRTLRTAYNRAVEQGLTNNLYPFKHVYTGKDKTIKRAL